MSKAIHNQLWACIDSRLARGDTLVRPRDFQVALEADYTAITGQQVSRTVRRTLANAVVTINRSRPKRYVAAGVQNSARRAFQSACTTLRWDPTRIRMSGPMAIARFKSHDRVRELLEEVGLRPSTIDAEICVRHALQVASGEREPLTHRDPAEPFAPAAPVLTVVTQEGDRTGDPDRPEESGHARHPEISSADRRAASASVDAPGDAIDAEEDLLSNEERRQGALVGHVEMRIADTARRVLCKLMPSPDGSGKYLLAQRNAETGELEPVMRRGAPRPIARGIDGVWRESS